MTAPTQAAVRKADWDRFKLDGGSLVIYPRDGHPRHPLYLSGSCKPMPYRGGA